MFRDVDVGFRGSGSASGGSQTRIAALEIQT